MARYVKGQVLATATSGLCKVICTSPLTVRFIETGYEKVITAYANLRKGYVKDPYYKSIFNKGFFGEGAFSTHDKRLYHMWYDMFYRCNIGHRIAYNDCDISEDWNNFQNFSNPLKILS